MYNISTVVNCYAAGCTTATTTGIAVADLCGFANCDECSVTYGYWNEDAAQIIDLEKANPVGMRYHSDGSLDTITSETSAYMKSNEFVALLNTNVTADATLKTWTIVSGLNNGYPVLDGVGVPEIGTQNTNDKIANPTSASVLVNGSAIAFQAYQIDGSNYFKLRDLAKVLNSTGKQIEVGWDNTNNAMTLTSGEAYTAVGGELSTSGITASTAAVLSTSKVCLNGIEISLTAYTIGGNNYFKLWDLASALNFGVIYDSTTNTIEIDTATGYTAS